MNEKDGTPTLDNNKLTTTVDNRVPGGRDSISWQQHLHNDLQPFTQNDAKDKTIPCTPFLCATRYWGVWPSFRSPPLHSLQPSGINTAPGGRGALSHGALAGAENRSAWRSSAIVGSPAATTSTPTSVSACANSQSSPNLSNVFPAPNLKPLGLTDLRTSAMQERQKRKRYTARSSKAKYVTVRSPREPWEERE